ncbi:MAG TPA: hypothetical protein VFS48_05395 [Solirubrobacterales bacterium]|nr:hypothetical protein [Solirubrobacterales bacterium]
MQHLKQDLAEGGIEAVASCQLCDQLSGRLLDRLTCHWSARAPGGTSQFFGAWWLGCLRPSFLDDLVSQLAK